MYPLIPYKSPINNHEPFTIRGFRFLATAQVVDGDDGDDLSISKKFFAEIGTDLKVLPGLLKTIGKP